MKKNKYKEALLQIAETDLSLDSHEEAIKMKKIAKEALGIKTKKELKAEISELKCENERLANDLAFHYRDKLSIDRCLSKTYEDLARLAFYIVKGTTKEKAAYYKNLAAGYLTRFTSEHVLHDGFFDPPKDKK